MRWKGKCELFAHSHSHGVVGKDEKQLVQLKDAAILGLGLGLAMRCQIWNYSYVLKLMAILGPNIVGLLDAIGPMPSRCTNSPPLSF